jgi:hypothetical protein
MHGVRAEPQLDFSDIRIFRISARNLRIVARDLSRTASGHMKLGFNQLSIL